MGRLRGLVLAGVVLAVLGLIGMAIPVFSTTKTTDVVKLGDLKVQAKTQEDHVIPPLLSQGLLALGVVLIGAGLFMNRRA